MRANHLLCHNLPQFTHIGADHHPQHEKKAQPVRSSLPTLEGRLGERHYPDSSTVDPATKAGPPRSWASVWRLPGWNAHQPQNLADRIQQCIHSTSILFSIVSYLTPMLRISTLRPGPPQCVPYRWAILLLVLTCAGPSIAPALGQDKAAKPAPDVIVFTNGDQLSGILERGVGNSIIFRSDMAGEITVTLDRVRELRSSGSFAVLRKDVQPTRQNVLPGTLIYEAGKLTVAEPTAEPEVVPVAQIGYIIDQPTYDMELERKPGARYGWHGNVNGGATLVRSTNNGDTLSVGISLNRAIPAVPYLPARNRTSFNLQETYGKLTQPVIPKTNPPAPPLIALTSIFHTDAERDEYFSTRFYGLVQTSFDHNYAQGLDLQQIYGGGIGWTPLKTPIHQLDIKADVHYENQQFRRSSSNLDLVGSTLSETYRRYLPRKLVLTETASILPAWNNTQAYSANGSVALALPLLRRLSLTVTSTDNFLNDPSPGYKKNSFQFITGASYTLR
ncbi:MAG: hypothetical protein NVSMB62_23730 [Acidobacteriaceae bacterium]